MTGAGYRRYQYQQVIDAEGGDEIPPRTRVHVAQKCSRAAQVGQRKDSATSRTSQLESVYSLLHRSRSHVVPTSHQRNKNNPSSLHHPPCRAPSSRPSLTFPRNSGSVAQVPTVCAPRVFITLCVEGLPTQAFAPLDPPFAKVSPNKSNASSSCPHSSSQTPSSPC